MNMRKVKPIACIISAASLLLSLTACGNSNSGKPDAASGQAQSSIQTDNSVTADSSETNRENENSGLDSKILIAYFTAAENSGVDAISSASYTKVNGEAVGRIRAVADMIADNTGGELFSIKTETVYPTDGRKLIDYAAEEQDNNVRPVLTSHIENLDDYDVIFVGYPNWWYDMPMALYSFFDEYDFSGKTIIPFNVHNGSRFSSTISTIQELEPDAEVITDGFTVSERDVAEAADDVAAWLDGIGY
ncbi:MAG: flavodoxin [Huintestinicola sp.]